MSLINPESAAAAERIKLVPGNTLTVAPGHCITCGYSDSDRRYVDPQIDVDFYGAFFFCEICVGQMASLFDWATPDQVHLLQEEITELDDHVTLARAQVERQEEIIHGLQRIPTSIQDVKSIRGSESEFDFADTIFNQADEPADEPKSEVNPDVSSTRSDYNVGSSAADDFIRDVTAALRDDDQETFDLNI